MTKELKLSSHLLRSKSFDIPFLLAIPFVAVSFGLIVSYMPQLFPIILIFNLWLLGYHHVISTFTRIGFSAESRKEFKFLIYQLPLLVIAAVALLTIYIGGWVIATIYLYWQWFHYTRQSYGVSRFYSAKSGIITKPWQDINTYALYLLPLTGILYRSYQAPEKFLYMDVVTLPVPYAAVMFFLALSCLAILAQIINWIKQYKNGSISSPHVMYVISHHVIFATGYMLIDEINYGWLVLNIWHNAQYIAFVWMYNNNRFKGGIDEKHKLISKISQNGRFFTYIMVCLGLTFVIYLGLVTIQVTLQDYTLLPISILLFMSINFHHYIVDSIIWKRKKTKPL